MENISITSLPLNILDKITYLKHDYIGLNFDHNVLYNLILGLIIALGLIIISFLFGKKLRHILLKNELILKEIYLVDIAIGFITISTGIALLGFFSLLSPSLISLYLLIIALISFFPYNNLPKLPKQLYLFLKIAVLTKSKNKFVFFWVLLFVFLAIINLINPEIREDQYHVDFPKMYLASHSIMIPPREQFHVSGSPMLSEMYYSIGIFFWSEESARFIHFIFYILVLLILFEFAKINKYKFSIYAPLLFVTAPVVIHETSSMYVDFEWMFCFLLSILILTVNKKLTYPIIAVSGFILGGMLSSKLWTIVFIPVSILYLLILINKFRLKEKLKYTFLFIIATVSAPFLWLARAFLLTGDPLFPAFANIPRLEIVSDDYRLFHYFTINYPLLNPFNYLNVFSPLFFLGCLLFLYKFRRNIKLILKLDLFKYFLMLLLLYLCIQYPYGRYLLGLYVLFIFVSSVGLNNILLRFKASKYLLNLFLIAFFLYYFINSVLILPYAFGFSDRNRYLTRLLTRDNSSYYDFDRQFDKHISKKDYVATYGVFGYYYANFRYLDVNFVFDTKNKSFDILKEKGFTKLFIKGGDMNYFCKRISLSDCKTIHYALVSSYSAFPSYYLYNIK